jgi:hypothetical protein
LLSIFLELIIKVLPKDKAPIQDAVRHLEWEPSSKPELQDINNLVAGCGV